LEVCGEPQEELFEVLESIKVGCFGDPQGRTNALFVMFQDPMANKKNGF